MTILQALAGHYDRLASRGDAPPYGFSNEKISFAILLSSDGSVVDVQSLQDMSGKKPLPGIWAVPRPVKRTSGVASNFLWDKTAYALGVKVDVAPGTSVLAEREFAAFKALHEALLADSEDEGLSAFLAFLRTWQPTDYGTLRHAEDMLAANANLVFRLDDGELQFLHDRGAARTVWANHLDKGGGSEGLCLVTGGRGPVARLHPAVKGVRGAQSSGASIVSFNLDAFESFDKLQGANAPVSERAAFAYTTALNVLLAPGSRQRIQIGDTTTVFWAEARDPDQSAAAEDLFSVLVAPPTDEEEAATVRNKLQAIADGRPLAEVAPEVREDTRFYVLGLAPNAARLSIRFWHAETIGTFAERIAQHWRDLQLKPTPWASSPPVWRLLYETATQRKAENIPPMIGGALMRSILTGTPYPRALLAAVVARVRADKDVNGVRAAICKAIIARNRRILGTAGEGVPVALQENSNDTAYNLGRLFAAYAHAERSLAERNATLRDKYAGAASATPLRVFPVLMRGYEHNRAGLAKAGGKKAGTGVRVEQAVGQIVGLLPGTGDLPVSLTLEQQARFFIGFYHQERSFFTRRDHGGEPEQLTEGEE